METEVLTEHLFLKNMLTLFCGSLLEKKHLIYQKPCSFAYALRIKF